MSKIEDAFANIMMNLDNYITTNIGSTVLGKTITYITTQMAVDSNNLPIIVLEENSVENARIIEVGGRKEIILGYNIWVYAGGTGNEKTDEYMKQYLKGKLYNLFSRKMSLSYYDYINNVHDGYYSTDIGIRDITPDVYSKLDSHKFVCNLIVKLKY